MGPRRLPQSWLFVAMLMLLTTNSMANAAASELEHRGTTRVSTGRLWFPGANNKPLNSEETLATPTRGTCCHVRRTLLRSTAVGSLHTVPVGKLLQRFTTVDCGVHVGFLVVTEQGKLEGRLSRPSRTRPSAERARRIQEIRQRRGSASAPTGSPRRNTSRSFSVESNATQRATQRATLAAKARVSRERRKNKWDSPQPYVDKAHAQEHFLSVLKDVKQRVDAHHGLSKHDPAFGRRWRSCAIVRPATTHCVHVVAALDAGLAQSFLCWSAGRQ
jgi:hypothetical protein